ncbi:nitroreductase [Mesorhizobium escarrei]|uniref:Nitroreductase n=1 Tax=Mesorhizobium escarrei TaxID=666018 RepID=A0ABM9EGC0_9HYPH|nr:nitroreductase [Mesorhizobium escarrei]CAH2408358.1 Nitroreductase [Mesorhizobium escarrei]
MSSQATEADFDMLVRLIRTRHSCRAFQERAVSEATIRKILETAQRSASDCNIQPWKVTIVSGAPLDSLRTAMYRCAASGAPGLSDIPPIEQYFGAYQERRRDCGWSLYGSLGIERGDRVASGRQALENFRFFGAQHIALITSHASLGMRGVFDSGGYIALFMLAAHALGVATVAQGSIAHRADVIREHIAIPTDHSIICGIAFGWSDDGHPANSFRMKRASITDVASFVG